MLFFLCRLCGPGGAVAVNVLLYTLFILTACSFNAQLLCFLVPLLRPFKYVKVWPTSTQSIQVYTISVLVWNSYCCSCFVRSWFLPKCFSPALIHFQCFVLSIHHMNLEKVRWISLDATYDHTCTDKIVGKSEIRILTSFPPPARDGK